MRQQVQGTRPGVGLRWGTLRWLRPGGRPRQSMWVSRLRLVAAATPSYFWSYKGPGAELLCQEGGGSCKEERFLSPVGWAPSGPGQAAGSCTLSPCVSWGTPGAQLVFRLLGLPGCSGQGLSAYMRFCAWIQHWESRGSEQNPLPRPITCGKEVSQAGPPPAHSRGVWVPRL